MERGFDFSLDEYYHIYNRGVDKRFIFGSDMDYRRFLMLLYLCNSNNPVDIAEHIQEGRSFRDILSIDTGDLITALGAYVLMPNHFHLLVKETEVGGVSKFMGKVSTGYSMYFNKKYERDGSLFQSRFQAKHISKDEYLKYVFAYIHLNPIKLIESNWKEIGIKNSFAAQKFLSDYSYSSYFDYIGIERLERKILNTEVFPDYFGSKRIFKDFVFDWLSYKNNENS
ncbi:MAG: transposase [Parcubacteria group bacterium]|nr:transposase [Parcubacteria group bacterium]